MDQRVVSYLAFNPNSVNRRLTPPSPPFISGSEKKRKKKKKGKKRNGKFYTKPIGVYRAPAHRLARLSQPSQIRSPRLRVERKQIVVSLF